MKKIFKLLSVCILALTCALSSACVFSEFNYTYNPNVDAIVQDVEFGTPSARQLLSKEDATALVERSVVLIDMTDGGLAAGVITDLGLSEIQNSSTIVYIITCYHVIAKAGEITVSIPDEKDTYYLTDWTFTGYIGSSIAGNADKAVTLVGADMDSDLAVLKLDLSLPAVSGNLLSVDKICKAKIAPNEYVARKGETVFAVGNPTGMLPGWACYGEISSLEQTVTVDSIGSMKLMGISATTNPGNSGGGLFNLYGELIGITNAGNTNYEAINFAIPLVTSNANVEGAIDSGLINIVKNLVGTYYDQNGNIYSTYGYVPGRKAKFGFVVEQSTSGGTNFIKVSSVTENSLASVAGLKKDDILLRATLYNSEGVTKATASSISVLADFSSLSNKSVIGDKIKLTVSRKISVLEQREVTIELDVKQYIFGGVLG